MASLLLGFFPPRVFWSMFSSCFPIGYFNIVYLADEALRRAAVQLGVLQSKDVHSALVAGGTEEGGIMAEVDAVETMVRGLVRM